MQDESGYDGFHKNADEVYRVVSILGDTKAAVTPAGMAAGLKAEIPAVRNTVRLMAAPTTQFAFGDQQFEEKRVFYTDPAFMNMFSFPLVQGDRRTALSRPNSVLITQEMAVKYFGNENPIGKTLRKDNRKDLVVTGVFTGIPFNSQLQFNLILPIVALNRTDPGFNDNGWNNFNFYTYVQLDQAVHGDAPLRGLEKRIDDLFARHNPGLKANFSLQPLTAIHLSPEGLGDLPGHGDRQYVTIFFFDRGADPGGGLY